MQSSGKERPLYILMAILLVALSAVVADTIRDRVIVVGDNAPRFSVTTDSGKTISRTDFGGRLLVLNFWASWCQPCIDEMPSLNTFQKGLAGNGVVVLGLSVDHNEKAYRNLLNRFPVAFQTARDPSADISASYGTFKYPETYVINTKGEVVEKFIGPQNWNDPRVVNRIKSML